MPSVSKAQQHFMGMEYAAKKAGKPTSVKMTTKQLRDFAATKTQGLPAKKDPERGDTPRHERTESRRERRSEGDVPRMKTAAGKKAMAALMRQKR